MSLTAGFALCGSFCTIERVLNVMERMAQDGWKLVPIVSEPVFTQNTRFGKAQDTLDHITHICGQEPLHTLQEVEPIGPQKLLDVLIVAPCTGKTGIWRASYSSRNARLYWPAKARIFILQKARHHPLTGSDYL